VIPSPRMVAADHVGLDDLGYVMLHHEHVESKAGLPYPYDQDLSGVLLHLDVVSASGRAKLANAPLTVAYLVAAMRLMEQHLGPVADRLFGDLEDQNSPEGPLVRILAPFLTRYRVVAEVANNPEPFLRVGSMATFRYRWAWHSHFVADVLNFVKFYVERVTIHGKPWAFISHDSRDKESFVTPLAAKLHSMECPVWYDEYSLRVGQSLSASIDKGLRDAPKCILVLSPNFLSNPGWTRGEFNAAVNKHFSKSASVLLPIWYNVSQKEVAEYSLLVADIVALRSNIGVDELAKKLLKEISPL
jgi:TIR domain